MLKPLDAPKPPAAPKPMEAAKPTVEARRGRRQKRRTHRRSEATRFPRLRSAWRRWSAIFAVPKLLNRGPEASPESVTSAPETRATQPKAKTVETSAPAEKLVAKRSTSRTGACCGRCGDCGAETRDEAKRRAMWCAAPCCIRCCRTHRKARSKRFEGPCGSACGCTWTRRAGSSGTELDSAGPSKYFANLAVKAARNWEFTPAKVDGQNAPSEWVLRFEFAQDGAKVTSVQAAR